MESDSKNKIQELLSHADIVINGDRPWDIRVHNGRLYSRVLASGSLGLGESYMDGWWDCDQLDELFFRVLRNGLDKKVKWNWPLLWRTVASRIFNRQTRSRTFTIGEKHYDIGNDLFELMLGKSMAYSCGYWPHAKNLDEAQEAKFDLICRKLGLKRGMTLLDIGCGWGTLMRHAVRKYDVTAVGITVSKKQAELARGLCKGLPVDIRLQDYRDLKEKFDRVVSVGMFEHVGYKNYQTYMRVVHQCLKDGGLFLLHTIGSHRAKGVNDPWVDKYIFPNGSFPSIALIADAIEPSFVMEDWHNFGADYDRTLLAWHENFTKSWSLLKGAYDEKFYRMWRYYLLMFAGLFRSRRAQLWQIVLSKKGVFGGYQSIR